MTKNETTFSKDPENKKLTVLRTFDAPLEQVWQAWTDDTILDQWWAPRPWKTETKNMDFREGGNWLYAMAGPTGEKHWCIVDFKTIRPSKSFSAVSAFCDEAGRKNPDMPVMNWNNQFTGSGDTTQVRVELTFDRAQDLEAIIAMGFKEGFTMGLGNLDEVLAKTFFTH